MSEEMIEKGLLLTYDEIRILFYGMGVAQIEGVYMPEKLFTEEEILLAMHHMSKSGFIEAGSEKFRIREDVREVLEVMASPEWTDIWRPHGDEGPSFFLYGSGKLTVVSEKFWKKKDTLRIAIFKEKEFEKWREEFMDDHCGG